VKNYIGAKFFNEKHLTVSGFLQKKIAKITLKPFTAF